MESESRTITVNAAQGETPGTDEAPDNTGLIIGLCVGGVVLLAAIGVIVWLVIRKRRNAS